MLRVDPACVQSWPASPLHNRHDFPTRRATDDRTDALGCHAQRIVEQMAITRSRRRLSITRQRTNHRQREPGGHEMAGIGMPQIVDAKPSDPSRPADALPTVFQIFPRLAAAATGKYPWRAVAVLA